MLFFIAITQNIGVSLFWTLLPFVKFPHLSANTFQLLFILQALATAGYLVSSSEMMSADPHT